MTKLVLLGWQKEFPKISTATLGDNVIVRATAELYIRDEIVALFNIPVATDQAGLGNTPPPRSTVREFERKFYGNFADATGSTVAVRKYERDVNVGKEVVKKVARLEHPTLKTGKGKPRSTTAYSQTNHVL